MTPKQYLIFILSGLCADVIKGELGSGCLWADGRGGRPNCKDDMEERHTCVEVLVTKERCWKLLLGSCLPALQLWPQIGSMLPSEAAVLECAKLN